MAEIGPNDVGATWMRQFSLRWVLALTAVCAVVALLIGSGVRGSWWGYGVVAALLALLVVLVVHAAVFGCVWLIAAVWVRPRSPGRESHADDRSAEMIGGRGREPAQ